MSIVVHHLNNSRSQRILWLLEELELSYEVKKYQRTLKGTAPPELLAINPLGKSPVISDTNSDGSTIVLAESGAIVEYLIMKYGKEKDKINPSSSQAWIDNLYFSHYAEGSLQPQLVRKLIFDKIPQNAPALLRPILSGVFRQVDKALVTPELKNHGKMIEDHLAKQSNGEGWFAGGQHPTSADYLMSFCLETFISRSPEFVGPKTREYVKRIHARPAYKRAIEKGGEYAYGNF